MNNKKKRIAAMAAALLVGAVLPMAAKSAPMPAMTDEAYVVPRVAATTPTQDESLLIEEKNGRWLVSDKALQDYGIYRANDKKGTYKMQLPEVHGTSPWKNRTVSLVLPKETVGKERLINIRYIRKPLGIPYQLEGDWKYLVRPAKATRTMPVLRRSTETEPAAGSRAKQGAMGMVLFWDPVMNEKSDIQAIDTKRPIMSPGAFRLSKDGVIVRHEDMTLLAAAYRDKGYAMWPLVDNQFDPKVTHTIVTNESLQQTLIKELIGYALLYDFKGYNLDFENVNYADKDMLTAFVQKISDACHAYGLQVSMDVTLISDSLNWSQVYDRPALAKSLDYMMIMAYDQYGRTSPVAGPCASYPWVQRGIEAMVTQVPADKLILGMPLYMRLWYESMDGKELPKDIADWPKVVADKDKSAPSGTAATAAVTAADTATAGAKAISTKTAKKPTLLVRTLTMADSEAIMERYKDYVVWNDELKLYYLELPLVTGTVKIWFEDETSLVEKTKLISTYHLGGASFWRKGFEPMHFWQGFAKHELT